MAMYLYLFLYLFIDTAYSKSRLEGLQEIVEKEGEVFQMSMESFKKFVVEQGKNYSIVVLFTTRGGTIHCPACEKIISTYQRIAHSYKINEEDRKTDKDGKKFKPVFFGVIYFEQKTQEIFQKMQFLNIPNIFVSIKALTFEGNRFIYPREKMWQYKDDEDLDIGKLMKFINTQTGNSVDVHYTFTEKVLPFVVTIGGILIVIIILASIVKNIKNPKLWWIFAMIVNVICVGGVVFDMLHGNSLTGIDQKTGETEYIASGARSQFIFEGFFMSFVMVLGGLSIIYLNASAQYRNPWLVRLLGILSLLMSFGCFYFIVSVYKIKVSWYGPSFEPPSHYLKGPLLVDQGNSF